uniref:Non-structural maintenance of chromosomes element 4 n=1 Tax=Trichuris muris TaxID=70415 RepID=A0A5S6QF60_TRIMR
MNGEVVCNSRQIIYTHATVELVYYSADSFISAGLTHRPCRRLQREEPLQGLRRGMPNFDAAKLTEIMGASGQLLEQVDRPLECSLEASVVKGIAQKLLTGSAELCTSLGTFDPEDFADKLVTYLRREDGVHESSYLGEGELPFDSWAAFGRTVASKLRTVSAPQNYYGLEPQEPVDAPETRRRKSGALPLPAVPTFSQTTALQTTASEADDDRCLRVDVQALEKSLLNDTYRHNNTEPIDFLRFILHPTKFNTTVENYFHLSFLIHDHLAEMVVSENAIKSKSIRREERSQTDEQQDSSVSRRLANQSVLALSVKEWKALVQKFRIVCPMSPDVKN